jgi:hypothetical protein
MNEQLANVQVSGELLNIKQKLNVISVPRSSKSAKKLSLYQQHSNVLNTTS